MDHAVAVRAHQCEVPDVRLLSRLKGFKGARVVALNVAVAPVVEGLLAKFTASNRSDPDECLPGGRQGGDGRGAR